MAWLLRLQSKATSSSDLPADYRRAGMSIGWLTKLFEVHRASFPNLHRLPL